MLIKSDLIPLPFGGRYRLVGATVTMNARDALHALMHNGTVEPADAVTAELVATRLATRGNDTRAQMVLRAAGVVDVASEPDAADVVFDDSAAQADLDATAGLESQGSETEAPAAEPVPATAVPAETLNASQDELAAGLEGAAATPETKTEPEPDHADQATDIKAIVDAAGENVSELRRIAFKVGLTPGPRPKADRLRQDIFAAAAKRTAQGLPPVIS